MQFLRQALLFLPSCLMTLLIFGIPIEHKYDKLFRFFSLKLIPKDLVLPKLFDPKIYFYLSDIVAIVLAILTIYVFKISIKQFFLGKYTWCLWGIFFASTLSILFSSLSHYPILYIRLIQCMTPILVYAFLVNGSFVQNKEVFTKQLFIALLFAALIQSSIAICQYVQQGPLGLRLFGEIRSFDSFWNEAGTGKWTLDVFLPKVKLQNRILRAPGTLPHTNILGGFLCVALLASYSFKKKIETSFWFKTFLAVQFFSMTLTYSRAALFAWCLGTGAWFSLYLFHQGWTTMWQEKHIRHLGMTLISALLLSGAMLYSQYTHRGGVINYPEQAKASDAVRIYHQKIAFNMIQDKPLTGIGYQQFGSKIADYLPNKPPPKGTLSAVHNIFLFVWAETGIFSLCFLLVFIYSIFKQALKAPFSLTVISLVSIWVAFLFIGLCDFYPIFSQQGRLLFFSMGGLLFLNTIPNSLEVKETVCR